MFDSFGIRNTGSYRDSLVFEDIELSAGQLPASAGGKVMLLTLVLVTKCEPRDPWLSLIVMLSRQIP
jgi:hypothetical protein